MAKADSRYKPAELRKESRLTLRLTAVDRQRLDVMAEQMHMTPPEVLRALLGMAGVDTQEAQLEPESTPE